MAHHIGKIVEYRKSNYHCVSEVPHIRKDGVASTLAVYSGACVKCGDLFEFKVPKLTELFHPTRHCALHKGMRISRRRNPNAPKFNLPGPDDFE